MPPFELVGAGVTVCAHAMVTALLLWLTLRARGRPGHGSVPHEDNAADHLVRALHRVLSWQRPLEVTPEVQAYFDALYEAGILREAPTARVLADLAEHNARLRSIQTNSISLTTLTAGVKHNVIPAQAEATLDCRLVPGYDAERFIAELTAVIDDPRIEIERVFVASTPDFTGQPGVANGASELLGEVFGDAGVHARSAVGVYRLPLNFAVEVDAVVQVGTNLAMGEVAAMAEFWLDKPVLAINTATYWYALRYNNIKDKVYGWGKLLAEH